MIGINFKNHNIYITLLTSTYLVVGSNLRHKKIISIEDRVWKLIKGAAGLNGTRINEFIEKMAMEYLKDLIPIIEKLDELNGKEE